jgi:hypothetical protein
MSDCLSISKVEFMSLPQNEKWGVMFENQAKTLELLTGYKTHQKVQYWMIGCLTAAFGWLATSVVFK